LLCRHGCVTYIIRYLHLGDSVFSSASLLFFAKHHKSFSNFLVIADLFLLEFFQIDSDFGLYCNSFHKICLIYFILSCIVIAILILLFFHIYISSWNIFLRDRYTIYVQRLIRTRYVQELRRVLLPSEEEVSFILLCLLCGFLFFGN
jgi:hypothetical protein